MFFTILFKNAYLNPKIKNNQPMILFRSLSQYMNFAVVQVCPYQEQALISKTEFFQIKDDAWKGSAEDFFLTIKK
jgi:hypothetical protein